MRLWICNSLMALRMALYMALGSLFSSVKGVKINYLTPLLCSCIISSVMEKIVRQGMLYDLYGELLTEHQQKIYGELVNDDLSLSEIAELNGITRQGAHDLIKRCDKILEGYEEKLHLLEKKLNS